MAGKKHKGTSKASKSAKAVKTAKVEEVVGKPLPPPFPVNPTIKFFRWSFLLVGIFYGATRRKHLAAKEVIIRAEEAKKKAIRDAEIAEHRRQTSERDVAAIAKLMK